MCRDTADHVPCPYKPNPTFRDTNPTNTCAPPESTSKSGHPASPATRRTKSDHITSSAQRPARAPSARPRSPRRVHYSARYDIIGRGRAPLRALRKGKEFRDTPHKKSSHVALIAADTYRLFFAGVFFCRSFRFLSSFLFLSHSPGIVRASREKSQDGVPLVSVHVLGRHWGKRRQDADADAAR